MTTPESTWMHVATFSSPSEPTDQDATRLALSLKAGFSGADTPIFENFFAGGFSTLRGFDFRGRLPHRERSGGGWSLPTVRFGRVYVLADS